MAELREQEVTEGQAHKLVLLLLPVEEAEEEGKTELLVQVLAQLRMVRQV